MTTSPNSSEIKVAAATGGGGSALGERRVTNVLLAGVGGQGVVLASLVLAQVAIREGYEVKQSEVHGMSQRGGSVVSHFRFGDKVWAPLVTPGTADILLAFETLEALRYLTWLRPGGFLVYNTLRLNPSPVAAGLAEYPADVEERLAASWPRLQAVPASALAEEAGTIRAANVVMLGAVSNGLPFALETWEEVIRKAVPPKTIEVNLNAFALGRRVALSAGKVEPERQAESL
ncbi:MAG: indolepyruvate oxidoreductase subunit beta [Thermoleophilia bacterium]|nr:indolepyruvate oxidoreductase subunit beta [Thermoleophilia bacterium]